MRKILSLMAMVACIIFIAAAQPESKDAKAKAILAQVSKKYRSYDVVKTEFTFVLDNLPAKVKETQQGILFVKANANKYKVEMTNQDLISDGKSQWTYLKDKSREDFYHLRKRVQISLYRRNQVGRQSVPDDRSFTCGYQEVFLQNPSEHRQSGQTDCQCGDI
jgi:outer membrane lipoprotein-sorting protein